MDQQASAVAVRCDASARERLLQYRVARKWSFSMRTYSFA